MKTYYLKIREKFIGEINAGNKKHEYRLASPERTQVKVGDTLFENKRDGVKRLKALMEEWGFRKHGYKPNGELVLVKTIYV